MQQPGALRAAFAANEHSSQCYQVVPARNIIMWCKQKCKPSLL